MGLEGKLGVALLAVLLGAFGFVLYKRIKDTPPSGEAIAEAKADAKPAAGEPEKPKLSSGPLKPTVVQSSASGKTGQALASVPAAAPGEGASRYPDENRTTRDPFASAASPASSRYGDRYAGTTQQIHGPASSDASNESAATTAALDASTVSTAAPADRADPFSRYGNRNAGGTLTPTGDASAALLPASATTEAPAQVAADRSEISERTTVEANPATDYNPLRSASADQSTTASSVRSAAPRGYDLYGDANPAAGDLRSSDRRGQETLAERAATVAERAATVAEHTSAATNSAKIEMPAGSDASSSRVRFGQSGSGARYVSEPASGVSASEPTHSSPIAERNPPSRYSTPAAVTDVPASPHSGHSGWSGAGTAATGVTTTPKSAAPPVAPVTQSKTPRAVPAAGRRGETYVVEPNDSFSTISEKLYGTASYFKALQEHNKAKYPRPDRLRTGDVVATPAVETLLQKYPNLCPRPNHVPLPGRSSTLTSQRGGRVYIVEEGDTLFDIARFELGKATRWAEIYELNKDVIGEDFNHLRPGTQLVLPAEMRDDTFTRRPGISVPR